MSTITDKAKSSLDRSFVMHLTERRLSTQQNLDKTAISVYLRRVVRKPAFCICENKDADQLRITAKLINAFVFALWIVQFLFYLNTKFQASSHLLLLYSQVCVRPGRKPRRPVFSQQGSYRRFHCIVLT